jgi:16S rRNA (adenine1518-N6/adenine1519-N6)-dimethyltransferase
MNPCDPEQIRQDLRPFGFHFSKAMGQNFLIDESIPAKMAQVIPKDEPVLEIGPGFGALTQALLDHGNPVIAIESDRRLGVVLSHRYLGREDLEIQVADALKTDLDSLQYHSRPITYVAANLPYSLTTELLTKLIHALQYTHMVLMIQKEVASRLCASPGSVSYGSMSVFCQVYLEVQPLFDVYPESFYPRPGVVSTVIHATRRPVAQVSQREENSFFQVSRGVFTHRRKTLLNGLCSVFPNLSKEEIAKRLHSIHIDPGVRGETLDIASFLEISHQMGE